MITTKSAFYYGYEVTEENNQIRFNDNGGVKIAKIAHGLYSMSEYAIAVQEAISEVAHFLNTPTVTIDRNRVMTITTTGLMELVVEVFNELSAYPMMGFTTSRPIGTSHTGDVASGSAYYPPYYLQDYVNPEHNIEYKDASETESASGRFSAVVFNKARYMECNIKFITDKEMSALHNSGTGSVDSANHFMQYISNRAKIEFIPDIEDTSTFYTLRAENFNYKLKEDTSFKDTFSTGNIKFRVVE